MSTCQLALLLFTVSLIAKLSTSEHLLDTEKERMNTDWLDTDTSELGLHHT